MPTKQCTKCELVKPLDQFGNRKTGKHGYKSRCKKCENAYVAQWFRDNRDRWNAHRRAKRNKNRASHVRVRVNDIALNNANTLYQIERKRLGGACSMAKSRGEEYSLTLEQWLLTLAHFGYCCAYCGGTYALLEHFIPIGEGVGTVVKNCVPACQSCNRLKHQNWNGFRRRAINLHEVEHYLSGKGLAINLIV